MSAVNVSYTIVSISNLSPDQVTVYYTLFDSVSGLLVNKTAQIRALALEVGVTSGMNSSQKAAQEVANFLQLATPDIEAFAQQARVLQAQQSASIDLSGKTGTYTSSSLPDPGSQMVGMSGNIIQVVKEE